MTPTQFSEAVAAEVRAEMARQHKAQAELAAVLDVSRPTAALRFRGEADYDMEELARVADWLDVPVERFIPRATDLSA